MVPKKVKEEGGSRIQGVASKGAREGVSRDSKRAGRMDLQQGGQGRDLGGSSTSLTRSAPGAGSCRRGQSPADTAAGVERRGTLGVTAPTRRRSLPQERIEKMGGLKWPPRSLSQWKRGQTLYS